MEELIKQCVGRFLDWQGLDTDRADDLSQVARTKCLEVDEGLPTSELRATIRNALVDHSNRDHLVPIPRSTYNRLSDSDKPLPERRWFDGDESWQERHATLSPEAEWSECVESYQFLYSLCRDDLDRNILETRWDNGQCLFDGPVHAGWVAQVCGVGRTTVYERLAILQRRYFLYRNQGQFRSLDNFCRILRLPDSIRPRVAALAGRVTNFYRFLSPPGEWAAISNNHRALHFVWLLRDRPDARAGLDLIERLMPRVGLGEIEKPFRYVKVALTREARLAA